MATLTSVVPKSKTRGFDSWLTSCVRIECNFQLTISDVIMTSDSSSVSTLQRNNINDLGPRNDCKTIIGSFHIICCHYKYNDMIM